MRASFESFVATPFALLLCVQPAGCVSKEQEMKLATNGVMGGLAGSQAHFAAEADTICGEMPKATTPFVPPMDKSCARGCRCAGAVDDGADADPRSTYDCEQWSAREWQLLRFTGRYRLDGTPAEVVFFHHQASWHRTEDGCQLDFIVHGDLDEDGVYSTYEATIEATPDGALGTLPDKSILWE